MGRDSTLYEIAQWYPRMAVYDDVRGWNTDPYLGQGEFYLEYGDIDYRVTVPAGYVVAGSGVLQNRADVLTPRSASGSRVPRKSDSVVAVITPRRSRGATPTVPGTKTWRFRAEHVRDVAWAAAPDFRWDATSWNGVLTQALYQFPKAGRAWESAAEQTQWSIRTYSELLDAVSVSAGDVRRRPGGRDGVPDVRDGALRQRADPASIFGTIDHEQGHEWFPMIVGSNERRYAWMDEGFNTYQNAFSNERRIAGHERLPELRRELAGRPSTTARQSPLMTPPDRIDAARARRDRLSQARRGAARAARQRRRPRDDGSRDARVRAPLGVQASDAGRFLPHRRERVRRGPLAGSGTRSSTAPTCSTSRIDGVIDAPAAKGRTSPRSPAPRDSACRFR